MKVGFNLLPDVTWEQASGQEYLQQALDLCALADDYGLDHIKITEHYLGVYGGYSPSPIVFLAAAAQRTRQARLITGCVLPVFHHPIHQAAELAMLDCLSNGRLEVGFARAWLPKEFEAFQVSLDGSRAVFTENIEAVTRLWTEEKVSFKGQAHQFENVTIHTRPVQTPHPPIWIAVTMTPQSYTWAGAAGYRLMVTLVNRQLLKGNLKLYHQAHQEAGRGPVNPEHILLGMPVYVAPTREQALAEIAEPFRNSQRALIDAANEWKDSSSKDYRMYNQASRMMEQNFNNQKSLETEIANGKLVAGTPDEVYAQLRDLEADLGISHFSLFFTFGGLDYEKSRRSLELFGREVLPRLRSAPASSLPTAVPELVEV